MSRTKESDALEKNYGGVRVYTPTTDRLKVIKERTGFSQGRSVTAMVAWVSKCPPEFVDLILGRVSNGFLPAAVEIAKKHLDGLLATPVAQNAKPPVAASGPANPEEYLKRKK